jgi:FkbM family methyltransferase
MKAPDLSGRTARPLDRDVVDVDGHVLRLDGADSIGVSRPGGYEPYESALLESLVTPGSTVIDAGANLGLYTVRFARATGPAGLVVAFEPCPETAALLAHNVRVNGYAQVRVERRAVADRPGRLPLHLSTTNIGDHRLYAAEPTRETVEVEVVRIDDVVQARGALSLVKMDIQGGEPHALRGMAATLAAHPEAWIATEFWPLGLAGAGVGADAYLSQVRALGGILLHIDEARRRVQPVSDTWLLETFTVGLRNHTNLLIAPRAWRAGGPWPPRPTA